MKIFANKKIWRKIVFAIGIIVFIVIVLPRQVYASGIGGTLITPVVDLFTGLADGVQTLIHKIFNNQESVLYVITEGGGVLKIILGVISGILGIALMAANTLIIGLKIVSGIISFSLSMAGIQIFLPEIKTISTNMLVDKSIVLPTFTLTPYEIFTGEEGIFSVNFFKEDKKQENKNNNEENNNNNKNITLSLNQNIRDWYTTLRLIAIVGMMSVLVYIGIRILLSSTGDKAKYKQMLWDWLVATFLIFTMQYIMVFANIMVDTITDALGTIKIESEFTNEETGEVIKKHMNKEGVLGYLIGAKLNDNGDKLEIDTDTSQLVKQAYKQLIKNDDGEIQEQGKFKFYSDTSLSEGAEAKDEGSANILFWPADNIANQARMNAQLVRNSVGNDSTEYIGYALVYVVLTVYTVIFIFVYIRRYVYMVFLTLISPLVALTYPIDKVKDGQAQAFNFWFKEYIYNLLLQPLHLIIYMLLIGSAMRFASSNPIYYIVCLGFMVPAEKLLKAMFGFKGQTPGSMPGVATAALMMNATRRLFDKAPKSSGKSGTNSKNDDQELKPIQTTRRMTYLGDVTVPGNPPPGNPPPGNPPPGNPPPGNPPPGNPPPGNPPPGNPPPGNPPPGNPPPGNPPPGNPPPGNPPPGNPPPRNSGLRLPKRSLRNGARSVGKFAGNVGEGALRTMTKVGTGLAIGSIGVAAGGIAGIVSGDPSKAFENMLTGGIAGYAVGSRAGENIGDGVSSLISSGMNKIDDFKFNSDPDTYKNKYNQKFTDEYVKDKEKMRVLNRNKVSNEQYQQLIKDGGFLEDYHKAGIVDPKEIAAMERYRIEEAQNKSTIEEALSIQKTYEDFYKGISGENSDKFITSLKNKIQAKNPTHTYTDAELDAAIKNTKDKMDIYDNIKFKIF